MVRFDCVEQSISRLFIRYGLIVTQQPIPFIVLPIFFTVALSVGFTQRNIIDDATYLYTPVGAPSRNERQVIQNRWPLKDGTFQPTLSVTDRRQGQVTVVSKDGGDILRKSIGDAVKQLNQHIVKNILVFHEGNNYSFEDLCLHTPSGECFSSQQVDAVYLLRHALGVNVSYPIFHVGEDVVYLGSSLGGAKVDEESHLISAKSWLMIYQMRFASAFELEVSGKWEVEFQNAMANYDDPLLKITYFHSQTLSEELKKNADRLTPKFALTFMILVAFAVICR